MANDVGKLDLKFLESQIRLIEPAFGHYEVDARLVQGMERIKSIVDTYGVDALEELAKVSRNFGTKPEDRGLNIYINTWIKTYLWRFKVASWIYDSKYILGQLTRAATESYFYAMKWLDREYLLEDVVTLSQGIVEAEILEGAAKCIRGRDYCLEDILNACRNAVRRGFIYEVADGTYDDTTKLRALLALRSSFHMEDIFWDLEIDDVEAETKVVRKLLKPTQERVVFCGDNKEDASLPVRWYSAGCVFGDVCHQLTVTAISDEMRSEVSRRDIPWEIHLQYMSAAFPYLERAVLCFNQGRARGLDRFLPPDKDWPAYAQVGADQLCSELAEKIQSLVRNEIGDSWSDTVAKSSSGSERSYGLSGNIQRR